MSKQLPFEVHACYRHRQGYARVSQHRSIKAAIRSLASVCAKPEGLYDASIWCARDNRRYGLATARHLDSLGTFEGIV